MKIAIIGGGASGCFASANIGYTTDNEVVVFEKTTKLMQKIKVSGGGRCNIVHACFDVAELIKSYPRGKHLLQNAFYRFDTTDVISWFENHGVQIKTESDGRMFPKTDNSQTVIDCILGEMTQQNVKICYQKTLLEIVPQGTSYELHFSDGEHYVFDRVLIAVGGLPKATQYNFMKHLKHKIERPVPSLFTFNMPKHTICKLMGISVDATVKIIGTKYQETGALLITHWGFSGPIILRCSAWAAVHLHEKNYQFSIQVNWLKNQTEQLFKDEIMRCRAQKSRQIIKKTPLFNLSKRLWEYMIRRLKLSENTRWANLSKKNQQQLSDMLLRDVYEINGKTTFKEEFVTCGGVAINEINPRTMESKYHKGIYFSGEVMNVDGITGGYNFQNAWTSGWIASQNMVEG